MTEGLGEKIWSISAHSIYIYGSEYNKLRRARGVKRDQG